MNDLSSLSCGISLSTLESDLQGKYEAEPRIYVGEAYFQKSYKTSDVYVFSIPGHHAFPMPFPFPDGYEHWQLISKGSQGIRADTPFSRTILTFKTKMFGRSDEFHDVLLPFLRYLIVMYGEP